MLLPRQNFASPRKLAYGGEAPEDPLLAAQRQAQQRRALAGNGAGEQVGQLVQQAPQLLSSLGIGGGAVGAGGAAGVLGAAGPVGAAVAAGALVGGKLRAGQLDANGFVKTGIGNRLATNLANTLDPIGNAMGVFKRDDLSFGQKLGATLLPGASSILTAGVDRAAKEKFEAEKSKRFDANASEANSSNTRAVYGGLPGGYAKGGLLPAPHRLAVGGELAAVPPPAKPKPPGAPVKAGHYSVKNPSPQAQEYYQNVLPTVSKMLGAKYDETYTDPATGKQCTANSCLSFATSVLEQSTGTQQKRTRQNLYNPEFTRTADQQGWQKIPLADARPGDRLQHWTPTGDVANGVDRQADLGGRQYIKDKYPAHMMVFGGYQGEAHADGSRNGVVYQDGHQFTAADRQGLRGINDQEYVAYRYIGVDGTPTNDPAKAVATNPAANNPAANNPVAVRAKGGLLPNSQHKSVIAHGALHSEKNGLAHPSAGKRGIPVLAADGTKLAEVERDELTLSNKATKILDAHRMGKGGLAVGKFIRKEILTNTTPSPRFAKRLAHAQGGNLVMLGPDGEPQMNLGQGGNRIFSRANTRELVNSSLKAKTSAQLKALGGRVLAMLEKQDKNKPQYVKE